MLRLGDKVRKR